MDQSEGTALPDPASGFQVPLSANGNQLQDMSATTAPHEVESFAKSNNLMHKLDIFQKAALIFQGEPPHSIPEITEDEVQALRLETERKWRQPKMLYFTILVCSIGAIEQGWAEVSMNGANLYFPKAFGIGSDSARDNLIVGFINSGLYMAGLFMARVHGGYSLLLLIPTIPLLLMVYTCPESPSWHLKSDRYDRAFHSLRRLRNNELQAAKELYATYLQRRSKANNPGVGSFLRQITELFTIPRIRRATVAAYVVMLSQQLCGINIVAFYSSTIFSQAGFSDFGALMASTIFGFVNFIGAFPAVWTMDTWGRRSLLLLTLPFMALTMLAAGLSYSIPVESPAHFGLLATLVYLFCAEYSPGMGPVPCAYSAEVFPLSHREVGMSFAVSTANCWATVLAFTFPRLLTALGSQGAFELYALLNVLALVLIFLFVPETRMKTLDDLDETFSVSTRTFINYQISEYLPWTMRRYVMGQKEAELKPLVVVNAYRALDQDDEDEAG